MEESGILLSEFSCSAAIGNAHSKRIANEVGVGCSRPHLPLGFYLPDLPSKFHCRSIRHSWIIYSSQLPHGPRAKLSHTPLLNSCFKMLASTRTALRPLLRTAPSQTRSYAVLADSYSALMYKRKGDQPELAPKAQKNVTKTSSGVTIATADNLGPVSTVALVLNAGSRYESPDTPGVAHFWKNTLVRVSFRREQEMMQNSGLLLIREDASGHGKNGDDLDTYMSCLVEGGEIGRIGNWLGRFCTCSCFLYGVISIEYSRGQHCANSARGGTSW